jgi:hypothetical protein
MPTPRDTYRNVAAWLRAARPLSDAEWQAEQERRRRRVAARAPVPVFPHTAETSPVSSPGAPGNPEFPAGDIADYGGAVVIGQQQDTPIGIDIEYGGITHGTPSGGGGSGGPGGIDAEYGGVVGGAVRLAEQSNDSNRPRYMDDYFDGARLSTEWTNDTGTWAPTGGDLRITNLGGGTFSGICRYNRYVYINAYAELIIAQAASGGERCVFIRGRYTAGQFTGYIMAGNNVATNLYAYKNDVQTVLGTGPGILVGSRIGVSASGQGIKGWIDGNVVISATDGQAADGYAGVALLAGSVGNRITDFHSYPIA